MFHHPEDCPVGLCRFTNNQFQQPWTTFKPTDYLSLMVHAYSMVSGQNHERTLESLGISGMISATDIIPVEDERLLKDLCMDPCGVLAWTGTR